MGETKQDVNLKISTLKDSELGTAFDEKDSDILSKSSETNSFILGSIPAKIEGSTGTDTLKNIGVFKFSGTLPIEKYDVLDMTLNQHAKFKMIFRLSLDL